MQRRGALPPRRIVVIFGDAIEPELLVVIRPDPFGRVDRALLQRLIQIAARDLLRHAAELLDSLAGPTADAEFQALEIRRILDLLAKPAAHLRAGVAADKRIEIELLTELVQQFHAVAVVEPRILLARVHSERCRSVVAEGRILADEII